MARRALTLREGKAPVWDRLLTMLFLAALLHGLVILGLTFSASAGDRGSAPGLEVLLVSDELPEADKNPEATYLAQRTQLGSGNTRDPVAPHNRSSSVPKPRHEGSPQGASLSSSRQTSGGQDERVLTTVAWSTDVRYLSDAGSSGAVRERPLLIDEPPVAQPGPQDEEGPAKLRGPEREELWITPDTRAATLAPYLDAWRRKVERIGTINYPTAARGAAAQASPVGGGGNSGRRHAGSVHHPPHQRQPATRPGGAGDPEAGQSLRPVPARAGRSIPGVALCLRMAVRGRARRERHRVKRSLRLAGTMPILGAWATSTPPRAAPLRVKALSAARRLLLPRPKLAASRTTC